ncbi:hypothetical protein ABZW11_24555 [Nonomuraea sp. NPDC004580]|uniref:hypothetical protein n=1 Tax=Nonomuraea sp. NPDC004580 TaxID=3154552 RepID=UPI0033B485DF
MDPTSWQELGTLNRLRRLVSVPAVALLATSAFWVSPLQAHADSAHGCPHPYVCIYRDPGLRGGIVARYQAITSESQSVTVRGFSAYNTRNGDVAHIAARQYDPNGVSFWVHRCIGPNSWGEIGPTPIQTVRIDSRSSC